MRLKLCENLNYNYIISDFIEMKARKGNVWNKHRLYYELHVFMVSLFLTSPDHLEMYNGNLILSCLILPTFIFYTYFLSILSLRKFTKIEESICCCCWGWGLNLGFRTYKAGTLPLEPCLQSILLWSFWRWGFSTCLSWP
jgi:hypothetical protein